MMAAMSPADVRATAEHKATKAATAVAEAGFQATRAAADGAGVVEAKDKE